MPNREYTRIDCGHKTTQPQYSCPICHPDKVDKEIEEENNYVEKLAKDKQERWDRLARMHLNLLNSQSKPTPEDDQDVCGTCNTEWRDHDHSCDYYLNLDDDLPF